MAPNPVCDVLKNWRRLCARASCRVKGQFQVHGNQPLVKTPSRFKSTFATVVHAASSAELVPAGSDPGAAPDKFTAAAESARYRSNSASNRATSGSICSGSGGRQRQSCRPNRTRARTSAPPSRTIRRASAWAASTYTGSFKVTNAWSGRVGSHSLDRADLAARGVEGGHRGIRHGAPPERIQPAAVAVCALAGRPGALAVERRLPETVGLRRKDARAAELSRKQAAQGHRLVAHHLGLEPHSRCPRQQAVSRIPRPELGSRLRRLPIGRRRHDQPQQRLRVPARILIVDRQPVEQLGVARRLALRAEVFFRLDEPRRRRSATRAG